MTTNLRALGVVAAALITGAVASAQGNFANGNIIGLESRGQRLVSFDAGTPDVITIIPITGLAPTEGLVGIDVRPATGELVGVGRSNRVYVIDPDTGIATPKGPGPFTPSVFGRAIGVNFNPVPDRLRITTNGDQSLRLNADTGVVAAIDTSLAYAAGDVNFGQDPFVAACAYSNAFAGAFTTTLYAIDSARDTLVTIGGLNSSPSPNGGQIFTIGALGVDTTGFVGMDISPYGGAFAVMNLQGENVSRLYTLNLATGAASMQGAIGGNLRLRDIAVRAPAAPRVFGTTGANRLVSFLAGRPGTLLSDVAITGLQAGETIEGLDVRPATGDLLALGSSSRVYLLDRSTGAATSIGATPFTPALTGDAFGFDFNPIPDRIRCVSNSVQNLRLNPNTGQNAAIDTDLAYAAGDAGFGQAPTVVGSAYTNQFAGATTTTLYGIDSTRDVLVTQGNLNSTPNSPNGGMLFTVGALGFDTNDSVGFDITPFGGAIASLTTRGATSSSLYTVNLTSGAASLIGAIAGAPLRSLAYEHPNVTRALALTNANQLVSFTIGTPNALSSIIAITGLQVGETLLGIEDRPTTGGIIGVGSTSRLYRIDRTTGVATALGAGPFTPTLVGGELAIDFNPTVDRLRLVTDAGQNLRLHPNTGAVAATDGNLAYAAGDANFGVIPREVAVAYNRSFGGATVTTMYGIDSDLDVLVTQGTVDSTPVSPNSGQLFTVGALGVNTGDLAGFDITPFGAGFLALTAPGGTSSTFYSVNLATGATTSLGTIGTSTIVRDVTILTSGL